MSKQSNHRKLIIIAVLLLSARGAVAQLDSSIASPCPEVLIQEKYDHHIAYRYRQLGWDTIVSCTQRQLTLNVEPYVPVQYFNGTYIVTQIPYNPPDTSFALGTRMPINTDDDFADNATNIPYPFYFFGIRKNSFVIGANGLVTFNSAAADQHCPWSYSAPLPWPSGTSGAPGGAEMRDAIYGIYEDTYPSPSIHTSGATNWGIYYGIQDEFPCRKIICSWNDVPQFSCTSLRCSYQIVCYEGSNIIEVHVKQREVCEGWNGGRGIIGIQNATGSAQTTNPEIGTSNHYVVAGSPSYFAPAGYNITTSSHNQVAFRFTPQGRTSKTDNWYRVFDDGRDSVLLTENPADLYDTNKYAYILTKMDTANHAHPTLTQLVVAPEVVSKYMFQMKFRNANGDWYDLRDTITIGIDTANALSIKTINENHQSTDSVISVCYGSNTTVQLSYPTDMQEHRTVIWNVNRIYNGQTQPLPNSMFSLDGSRLNLTLLPDPQMDTMPKNKIDTIHISANVDFISGCVNSKEVMILVYPNFDTTEYAGICDGEAYTWHLNGQRYTQPTTSPVVTLQSVPGCDSTVHLHLEVSATSHTVEPISDCKPITWRNGRVYSATNEGHSSADTVVLENRYGCDSVIELHFTIYPMKPMLESSLEVFDFDHLDVQLTDVSTGGGTRTWKFPDGSTQSSEVAYYSVPAESDGANIWMVEYSPYGCVDSTSINIPFNKETFWLPNIFTPDNADGNNVFKSVSSSTEKQEMLIYNRRGELIFHCEGMDCGWDGTDLDGNKCPQGAYVYIIRYTNTYYPRKTNTKTGTVTLVR